MDAHETKDARRSRSRDHPGGHQVREGIPRPWTAAVTGPGGTAVAVWFEEIIVFSQEILALIFLLIIAGVIYLLDIFIFKSRMPKREDIENAKGVKR